MKLKLFAFGGIVVLLFGYLELDSNKLESDPFIEYYASIPLRESPFPAFKGIIRLSAEKAQKRNHYRFEYDEQFRLKEVSFRLGKHLKRPNHTANYFFTTPVIKFEYVGDKEIRTFYDLSGNQVQQGGAWKEVFIKDKRGKNKTLQFEDKNGDVVENDWGIARYEWTINNDGSVIENRYNLKGEDISLRPGFEFYTIRLCYEENGMLALMQYIDKQGKLVENSSGVAQDKLHFDQSGKWYGWTVLDSNHQLTSGNGPNVAKGINTPNEYGYEIAIRYEDEHGKTVKNRYGFWGSKRFYDQFGNYDYTYFIDQNGQVGVHEKAGYSYAQYSWSRDGLQRLKVELLDQNKQPIAHKERGYALIKYEYGRNGKLLKVNYYDERDSLVNSKAY